MRKLFCLLLCCCLLLPVLAACGDSNDKSIENADPTPAVQPTPEPPPPPPAEIYVLDFADKKSEFLRLDTGSPGTDIDSEMAIVPVDGANALRLSAPNGGSTRLGINVDGLLGDKASDVRTVVLEVYAEYPSGNFSAVSGKVAAMSGDMTPFADTTWQIYLATRNPNPAILQFMMDEGFSADGPNLIEFSCTTNGPAERGESPAIIYIKSITFYNESNEAMSINTDAGWAAPDGFGAIVILGGWELPNPPPLGDPGGWQTWLTPGTDNDPSDYMPWEVLAASYGIVFVMDEPDSFEFVYFGKYNEWNWTQVNVVDKWDTGTLTIMWEDIGFDPTLIVEGDETSQAKIAMGNWNIANITSIHLLYDADAVNLD